MGEQSTGFSSSSLLVSSTPSSKLLYVTRRLLRRLLPKGCLRAGWVHTSDVPLFVSDMSSYVTPMQVQVHRDVPAVRWPVPPGQAIIGVLRQRPQQAVVLRRAAQGKEYDTHHYLVVNGGGPARGQSGGCDAAACISRHIRSPRRGPYAARHARRYSSGRSRTYLLRNAAHIAAQHCFLMM